MRPSGSAESDGLHHTFSVSISSSLLTSRAFSQDRQVWPSRSYVPSLKAQVARCLAANSSPFASRFLFSISALPRGIGFAMERVLGRDGHTGAFRLTPDRFSS